MVTAAGRGVPSGPRAGRARKAALDAAGGLLAEGGYGAVTVEAVAARSGVARTTIYRHWTTRQALVAEAVKSGGAAPAEPDTGVLDEDVRLILTALAEGLTRAPWARYLPSVLDAAQRDTELATAHQQDLARRQAPLRRALARGVRRGELPTACDLTVMVSALVGPLMFRRLVTDETVDADFAAAVSRTVLAGARNALGD